MTDSTAAIRGLMIAVSTARAEACRAINASEPVWRPDTLKRDFEVLGFMAPFVAVRRRIDGRVGSMSFLHRPRIYFGFLEDE